MSKVTEIVLCFHVHQRPRYQLKYPHKNPDDRHPTLERHNDISRRRPQQGAVPAGLDHEFHIATASNLQKSFVVARVERPNLDKQKTNIMIQKIRCAQSNAPVIDSI